MVFHVVTKSHLSVVLLLARHVLSVKRLLHEHYPPVLVCYEHEHLSGKISACERVLTIESEGAEVRHIGVEHDERDVLFVHLIRELTCHLKI